MDLAARWVPFVLTVPGEKKGRTTRTQIRYDSPRFLSRTFFGAEDEEFSLLLALKAVFACDGYIMNLRKSARDLPCCLWVPHSQFVHLVLCYP